MLLVFFDLLTSLSLLQDGSLMLGDEPFDKERYCVGRSNNVTIVNLCFPEVEHALKYSIYPYGKECKSGVLRPFNVKWQHAILIITIILLNR